MKLMKRSLIIFTILTVAALLGITVIYPSILRAIHRIEAPGIDLMETVEIGGIPQVLYTRGQNRDNPVILFLHGGPGFPTMPFLHDFQYAWEPYFTIVHWDQRNSGRTFHLSDPAEIVETLSFEQVLSDAYEVTQHIRAMLAVDTITIMGYSWGSVLGAALVQNHPYYFNAYIGVGQVVNMIQNEQLGFEALLEEVLARGNENHLQEVKALAPWPPNRYFDEEFIAHLFEVRQWQVRYGLATGGELGFVWNIMTSPYYSIRERLQLARINPYDHLPLFQFLFDQFDLRHFGTHFEQPVFFLSGDRDFQTPYELARDFLEEVTAPHRAFFLIPDAGHGAMHDNPAVFNDILLHEIRPFLIEE